MAPERVVDLRSDTVTRPGAAMRRAIAEAEVGDAVLGDDPTVAELERYAAELLGKDRALFFPSGIMANTAALLALGAPGTEAVIDAGGHILNWEEGAAAAWGGMQLRGVATPDGLLTPELAAEAIRPVSPYVVQTSVLCLENTHNAAGGRVAPLGQLQAVAAVARDRGVMVHLDGARLPNASAASGVPMREYAACADTVMLALSKGLGAPVGSMLAGAGPAMERAWRIRRRLGGGMRQAGVLAAAGLFGLRRNLDRLGDDHRRASRLADGLREIAGLTVSEPETNIVMIDLGPDAPDPPALVGGLEAEGVRVVAFGARRLRAVTHLDVDDAGVEQAVDAFRRALGG